MVLHVPWQTDLVTEDRVADLGRIVREVAAELTVALGGVMPAGKTESRPAS